MTCQFLASYDRSVVASYDLSANQQIQLSAQLSFTNQATPVDQRESARARRHAKQRQPKLWARHWSVGEVVGQVDDRDAYHDLDTLGKTAW